MPARILGSSINFDWRGSKGEYAETFRTDYDDALRETVDLPHDWGIQIAFGLTTKLKQEIQANFHEKEKPGIERLLAWNKAIQANTCSFCLTV